ncbi:winged helix-turn-helix transcriptional regulator [Dactylosporangium aurantiacum]|uniref:Winged helix-turn-helix transcriptional regulator n=1 Tax=Dactylosporangium aurantiacum TaxID=35754 RepID=A0A9Q9IUM9_9ACTN|nr:winged helix-turn-helix transcriptional regulator [Dactylosporangium aurantiacum]
MDAVAEAIADPARRAILELLRAGPQAAGDIAAVVGDRFRISRPAVSRHLRVLRECGLVRDTLDGRHRRYHLDATGLGELSGWLARFTTPPIWQQRMDALETEVYRARRDRRTAPIEQEERSA